MSNGLCFLGIPRERTHIPAFVDNRDRILASLVKSGRYCGYMEQESHRVDMNRDEIAIQFLAHQREPEWLLMLDSDMEHPNDIAERLIRWGKPLIGGLYFYRHDRFQPEVFMWGGYRPDAWGRQVWKWDFCEAEVYDFLKCAGLGAHDGPITIDGADDTALLECDAVGAGTMLIHRRVFEQVKPPWFQYNPSFTSEDLSFCKRAKEEAGIQVYCDMSTISGHYRYVPVSAAHFMAVYEANNNGNRG